MADIHLRDWQVEAIKKSLFWLIDTRQGKHFLLNAAPGSGKTICASVISKILIEREEITRVIVIAPRAEVVRQWAEEFQFVTGRSMTKVTGADQEIEGYGLDLCATWSAVQGLLNGFSHICNSEDTLVICDEHHHAAIEAAWGRGAGGAFEKAKYVLVLTGTPIRSDGSETVWFAYDDMGRIDHPDDGSYTLTYGEAVDYGYCRPITFHRHEGHFKVTLPDGEVISVSGRDETILSSNLKRIRGLQSALDFYKLACSPKFLADGKTPDINSYQASMLEWGISKLDDIRNDIPNAGGLVIAPSIEMAEYISHLLELMEDEKPTLVHSQMVNSEAKIKSFKNTNKRWLVSVSMISEGVDIKRLRILVYLPHAQTELYFRQAMGRVVRSLGSDDFSRAYVVMPTNLIFEEYARRVELEMKPEYRVDSEKLNFKICPVCSCKCSVSDRFCPECNNEFPSKKVLTKTCPNCNNENPANLTNCEFCGESFKHDFEITLNEALRVGAIVRGMDLDECEVLEGEKYKNSVVREVLSSGDDALIKLISKLPEESWGRLRKILNDDG